MIILPPEEIKVKPIKLPEDLEKKIREFHEKLKKGEEKPEIDLKKAIKELYEKLKEEKKQK